MKAVMEQRHKPSNEERNPLSVAYENVVGAHRSSRCVISSTGQKTERSQKQQHVGKEFREKREAELQDIGNDGLELRNKCPIPKATQPESKVFYLKMKGDYFRYLSEVASGDSKQTTESNSQQAHQDLKLVRKKCSLYTNSTWPDTENALPLTMRFRTLLKRLAAWQTRRLMKQLLNWIH